MNDTFIITRQPMRLAEWRALPDDVKAGVFQEIVELQEQDAAEHHWAWSYVRSFFENG